LPSGCLPLIGMVATLAAAAYAFDRGGVYGGIGVLVFGLIATNRVSVTECLAILERYGMLKPKKKGTKPFELPEPNERRTMYEDDEEGLR
jgi:hypothetical protein